MRNEFLKKEKDELNLEQAMKIQRKISDILVEEEVTIGNACTILHAFVEALNHYMIFGSAVDGDITAKEAKIQ